MIQPRRTLRYYYLRLARLKGNPQSLALGFSIGVFVGITPTIPFHTITILLLAVILRASKLAGLLSSMLVSNPLTFFFQYYFSWKIGAFLLQTDISWHACEEVLKTIWTGACFLESLTIIKKLGLDAILVLLSGGLVIAAPFAILSYVISLRFFNMLQNRGSGKGPKKAGLPLDQSPPPPPKQSG